MKIVMYFVVMTILAALIAASRFMLSREYEKKKEEILSGTISDSIDQDIVKMRIEGNGAAFESRFTLMKRGSWRLAQDKVLTMEQFEIMKAKEFAQML